MSRNIQSTWMFSPKSFVSLLGAEYHLMRDAGVLRRFYISSLLIIIILLLTWISIYYALDLLFDAPAIEILLAIFFCLLFFCIYIFLINTFAKENRKHKRILNASNIIRIGFVVFMGFLTAQPLVILLYSTPLASDVENYKRQLFNEHTAKINALINVEITKLATEQQYYTNQKNRFGTSAYDRELEKISGRTGALQHKKTILEQTAQQTIDRNSFFLFRVEKVNNKNPISWLLTLLVVLLFLMPGYLIYSISSKHKYYQLKKAREKEMVASAYSQFTRRYQTMFREPVTIFSRYEDPPFNKVRKQSPVAASITDFLQKYLNND